MSCERKRPINFQRNKRRAAAAAAAAAGCVTAEMQWAFCAVCCMRTSRDPTPFVSLTYLFTGEISYKCKCHIDWCAIYSSEMRFLESIEFFTVSVCPWRFARSPCYTQRHSAMRARSCISMVTGGDVISLTTNDANAMNTRCALCALGKKLTDARMAFQRQPSKREMDCPGVTRCHCRCVSVHFISTIFSISNGGRAPSSTTLTTHVIRCSLRPFHGTHTHTHCESSCVHQSHVNASQNWANMNNKKKQLKISLTLLRRLIILRVSLHLKMSFECLFAFQ